MSFSSRPLSRRAVLAAGLAAPLLACFPAQAQSSDKHDALLRALKNGGLIVYFRHGATDRGGVDKIQLPRDQQRQLSDEGKAQARAVGETFRRHGIGVGEVLSSPYARCHDFAQIAFGRVRDDWLLLGLLSQSGDRQARINHSLALLRKPIEAGQNRVLVAHTSNIADTTGVTLPEGGAVLVRPDAKAGRGFTVVGQLLPEDWRTLAGR